MSDSNTIPYELNFCKPIPGYNGKYFASSKGFIFSGIRGELKRLSTRQSISGYICIDLQQKTQQVHILVAKTWLENPNNLPIVNHKDGNKTNNTPENLEYVTPKENSYHARHILKFEPYKRNVCQVTLDGKLVKEYDSMAEASRITGIDSKTICLVCQGKRRKAGEFVWCYKENYEGKPMRKLAQCKPVLCFDLKGCMLKRYESATDAAEAVGALSSNISNACTGRLQTCKGFVWKYEEKPKAEDETKTWRKIETYPLYRISNDGRVYSTWTKRLKTLIDRGRYKLVAVKDKNGVEKKVFVHRLVAFAYIPNPNNYPIVNHKDGNPSNNNVENLEWCTYSQNSQHAHDTGLNKTKKAVIKMDKEGNELETYPSIRTAAKSIGLCPEIISHVCRGARGSKTAGGYRWKYA